MCDENTGQNEVPAMRSFLIKPSAWEIFKKAARKMDRSASAALRGAIAEYVEKHDGAPATRVLQVPDHSTETSHSAG